MASRTLTLLKITLLSVISLLFVGCVSKKVKIKEAEAQAQALATTNNTIKVTVQELLTNLYGLEFKMPASRFDSKSYSLAVNFSKIDTELFQSTFDSFYVDTYDMKEADLNSYFITTEVISNVGSTILVALHKFFIEIKDNNAVITDYKVSYKEVKLSNITPYAD